ncbi:substrate-binding periplasmic protein [Thalassolituus sp. LLYu03]|uniref:substrate-binding periplasmic protein n=1 Tax=Thalassolituus sp. LLYu03 TaxID=3421656 RepID=UPI003D2BDDBA
MLNRMAHCRLTLTFKLLAATASLAAGLLPAPPAGAAEPTVLHLGAADWCPYTCDSPTQPGIVTEYLTALLKPHNIELKVSVLPWSRAVKAAEAGQLNGLITLVEGEAPQLLMTTTATMSHQDCFYTTPESEWRFSGVMNLDEIRLGAIKNYGYGEALDAYITDQGDLSTRLQLLSGDNPDQRLFSMLRNYRIDAYISDRYVNSWQLKNAGFRDTDVRSGGCLTDLPFFMGFYRKFSQSDALATWLNEALAIPGNIRLRDAIAQKYR